MFIESEKFVLLCGYWTATFRHWQWVLVIKQNKKWEKNSWIEIVAIKKCLWFKQWWLSKEWTQHISKRRSYIIITFKINPNSLQFLLICIRLYAHRNLHALNKKCHTSRFSFYWPCLSIHFIEVASVEKNFQSDRIWIPFRPTLLYSLDLNQNQLNWVSKLIAW